MLIIAALMFLLLWARAHEARAQGVPVCPGVQVPDGWLSILVTPVGTPATIPDFSAGLFGTGELLGTGDIVGGMEWLYTNTNNFGNFGNEFCGNGSATDCVGSQVIGWWDQNNARRTFIQFTNSADNFTLGEERGTANPPGCLLGDPGCAPLNESVHVQILDEDCNLVRDFCDSYTQFDSHVYDLTNLVANTGQNLSDITSGEGIWIITPVVLCDTDNRATEFEYNFGSERIIDFSNPADDYEYGVNLWVRTSDDEDCSCFIDEGVVGCESALAGFGGFADILGQCEGCEPGDSTGCEWTDILPQTLSQNFNTLSNGIVSLAARSDLILMNFFDDYRFFDPLPGYRPMAAISEYIPREFNLTEESESCPEIPACYARLGLGDEDDPFPGSDEPFPTPTPTPTPSPTPTPIVSVSPTVTPTPTPGCATDADCPIEQICENNMCITGCRDNSKCPAGETCQDKVDGIGECLPQQNFGSSGSCTSIAGAAPVQLGTAMANILIPLVPALAIGFRLIRRKKKGQK
jgi:hypothetical protein